MRSARCAATVLVRAYTGASHPSAHRMVPTVRCAADARRANRSCVHGCDHGCDQGCDRELATSRAACGDQTLAGGPPSGCWTIGWSSTRTISGSMRRRSTIPSRAARSALWLPGWADSCSSVHRVG